MGIGELLFGGRINRGLYWMGTLGVLLAGVVFSGLLYIPIRDGYSLSATIAIAAILGVPLFAALFALTVKRLHDRDKSAWWLLAFYGLPTVFDAARANLGETSLAAVFALASLAIGLWAFVELGCLRGTTGYNEFGQDPLG